ncbi:AcrR family transcriptional regulator [Catenulispora sp. EB89]|uniref:TetR/AcrR family transcriptional regulator n=1 Tax=Catenulispora sp. EB89 TaxID=3156257 RepID=UPI00351254F8
MTIVEKTSRAGRPRAVPDTAPQLPPREQILLAAAALFVEQGFGSTSTRAIADAVGIRQASLYYHFAGKDDILAELLDRSVRPSAELARHLEHQAGTDPAAAAAALYALAATDAELLARAPHNIGSLYLIPEVRDERFDDFRALRHELQEIYGRLGDRAGHLVADANAVPPTVLGALLIQVVEVVIPLRRWGGTSAEAEATVEIEPAVVAEATLRTAGLGPAEIRAAAAGAAGLG